MEIVGNFLSFQNISTTSKTSLCAKIRSLSFKHYTHRWYGTILLECLSKVVALEAKMYSCCALQLYSCSAHEPSIWLTSEAPVKTNNFGRCIFQIILAFASMKITVISDVQFKQFEQIFSD